MLSNSSLSVKLFFFLRYYLQDIQKMKDYQKEREQMEDMKVMEYLKDKQVIPNNLMFQLTKS